MSSVSFADRVARLCPTHKGADNFPFTAPGAKFNLHKQNFPSSTGNRAEILAIELESIDALLDEH